LTALSTNLLSAEFTLPMDSGLDSSCCSGSAASSEENERLRNSTDDSESMERHSMCLQQHPCAECVPRTMLEGADELRKVFYLTASGHCRLCGMETHSHFNPKPFEMKGPSSEKGWLPWGDEELQFLRMFLQMSTTVNDSHHRFLQVAWKDLSLPARSRQAFHKKILQVRSEGLDMQLSQEVLTHLKARFAAATAVHPPSNRSGSSRP
jgi:hypothetical protein